MSAECRVRVCVCVRVWPKNQYQ
eukprot:SAG31_NODE_17918_length_653_cov_1.281588_1_plen_22_part_10